MERFAKIIAEALQKEIPDSISGKPIQSHDLEFPKDRNHGDFAFPCFRYSKVLKKAPPIIALEIKVKLEIKLKNCGISVLANGPYLNFKIEAATGSIIQDILKGDGLGNYGELKKNSRETWVMEYSSPNVAKPLMIYHLRGTALGATLARVGSFRGYKMVSINHLGDWGTQYGKLAIAYKHFGLPENPSVNDMVKIYVKFHEEVDKKPELEDEARDAFAKLEKNDPELTKIWKSCVDIAVKEFNGIYQKLGVKFDYVWGESFYKDKMLPIIEDFKKKGILVQSEGAWVVEVTDKKGRELVPCLMQKKDGATIYATRDISAAIYRKENIQFDRMTYIVGGEQKLHFQQVFAVLARAGFKWSDSLEHVPTGLYRFKDSKMSTRKGNFVTLEEVLDLAKTRVKEIIAARKADLFSATELEEVSEAVGIGAVVFNDLSIDPNRDVEFDLERVVAFDGETGPYLQYAHTRCLGILKKARAADLNINSNFEEDTLLLLNHEAERRLIKTLGHLPHHLERTLDQKKASQLGHYLIDLTKDFNSFYQDCKVISQDQKITQARLLLVEATRRILGRGLSLMGIPLPKKM